MTKLTAAGIAGLMLASGACVIAVVDRTSEGQAWPLQDEVHKSLDLKSGGAVALENIEGDIEISGWEEQKVDIVAYRSRELPPKAGLYFMSQRMSFPDIRAVKTGDTVSIKTEREGYQESESVVHYILKVPRSVRLENIDDGRGNILISDLYGQAVVKLKEGRLAVENYSGSMDISLEKGGVEAELLDPRPGDVISIKVERGDIIVYLEPEIGALFSLEAPGGDISSEIDLGQPLPAQKVSAKTGDGGVTLELSALQGDIKIRKVEDSR